MVTIYKEDGSSEDSEDIRNNMNDFKEKVHREAQEKQEQTKDKPLSFKNLSKQLSGLLSTKPNPQKQMENEYFAQLQREAMKQAAKKKAIARYNKIHGAKKIEKNLSDTRKLSQNIVNALFEQQRQRRQHGRKIRRINYHNMPPQLRNYYAQMEAQNSHSLGTKSSRTGGSASGSSTMYNSERLPSDFIIEPSFFNSNVKQIRPRTWSQHREKFTNYDTTQSRFNRKDQWLVDAENRVRDGW